MIGIGKYYIHTMVPLVGILFLTTALGVVGAPDTGSLKALERRALQAQALQEEVSRVAQQMEATKEQLRKSQAEIEQLHAEIAAQSDEIEKLTQKLAARDAQIKRQATFMRLLRSGAFEYYEVQDGDTCTSIAANPMVYGNAQRTNWIQQANGITPGTQPSTGTVLIIPRFTEGASYEF